MSSTADGRGMLCGSVMIRSTSAMFPSLHAQLDSKAKEPPQSQDVVNDAAAKDDAADIGATPNGDVSPALTSPIDAPEVAGRFKTASGQSASNGNLKALFSQVRTHARIHSHARRHTHARVPPQTYTQTFTYTRIHKRAQTPTYKRHHICMFSLGGHSRNSNIKSSYLFHRMKTTFRLN